MSELPPGRMPVIGVSQLVAALHRRRTRRREAVAELSRALGNLRERIEVHLERIASLRSAVEAQGGDTSQLEVYDSVMARLRAELASAEQAMADAYMVAGSW